VIAATVWRLNNLRADAVELAPMAAAMLIVSSIPRPEMSESIDVQTVSPRSGRIRRYPRHAPAHRALACEISPRTVEQLWAVTDGSKVTEAQMVL
jgi:hypothetical protein